MYWYIIYIILNIASPAAPRPSPCAAVKWAAAAQTDETRDGGTWWSAGRHRLQWRRLQGAWHIVQQRQATAANSVRPAIRVFRGGDGRRRGRSLKRTDILQFVCFACARALAIPAARASLAGHSLLLLLTGRSAYALPTVGVKRICI